MTKKLILLADFTTMQHELFTTQFGSEFRTFFGPPCIRAARTAGKVSLRTIEKWEFIGDHSMTELLSLPIRCAVRYRQAGILAFAHWCQEQQSVYEVCFGSRVLPEDNGWISTSTHAASVLWRRWLGHKQGNRSHSVTLHLRH